MIITANKFTLENPEQINPLGMILNNIIIPEVEEEQCNITYLTTTTYIRGRDRWSEK